MIALSFVHAKQWKPIDVLLQRIFWMTTDALHVSCTFTNAESFCEYALH